MSPEEIEEFIDMHGEFAYDICTNLDKLVELAWRAGYVQAIDDVDGLEVDEYEK